MTLRPMLLCVLLLASCAGGPPTFSAAITNADGKQVATVQGTVQDNKPWLERYGGPIGALLSGIGYVLIGPFATSAAP